MPSSPLRRPAASGSNARLGINDRYVPFGLHAPNEIKGSAPFILDSVFSLSYFIIK
jgi:hypothetical protein